jgi:hypothetical protein
VLPNGIFSFFYNEGEYSMNTQDKDFDIKAIHAAVEDYYNGWYYADVERVSRCMHPDMAKRTIQHDENEKEYLLNLTKEVMVNATRGGGGSKEPDEKKNWTITIMDVYREIASVKVESVQFWEYLHLVKQDGQWQVLNVLFTGRHQTATEGNPA